MKTITARFRGTCKACHEWFPAGTSIAYDGKTYHVDCAPTAPTAPPVARPAPPAPPIKAVIATEYVRVAGPPLVVTKVVDNIRVIDLDARCTNQMPGIDF